MSNKSTIDQLFKDQLNDLPLIGKEEMWERMERKLDAETNKGKSKKRYLLLLLLLAGGTFSFFLVKNISNKAGDKKTAFAALPQKEKKFASADQPLVNAMNGMKQPDGSRQSNQGDAGKNTISDKNNLQQSAGKGEKNISVKQSLSNSAKQSITIRPADAGEYNDSKIDDSKESVKIINPGPEKESSKTALTALIEPVEKKITALPPEEKKTIEAGTAAIKVKKEKTKTKISLGIAAGMDIFLKAREAGGYAGLQLTVPLNKKVNLVTGATVAKHKMEENYSNAEKQRLNPDKKIDAKLEGLTVLQVPVLYELPLPKSRIRFGAGVTPTYIIAAGIYNVPNSFTGNAANYRKFTLNDLHRLNVLFSANIGVGITKRLEAELKGNYGLTELVKNSYINQSSINNNFKSAQVGLIYKFGKKKTD